jgi:WD40 repeat protein
MERDHARNIAGVTSLLVAGAAIIGWTAWSSRQPTIENNKIVSLAVSKSGTWLAAGTASGRVAVWKLGSGAQPLQIHNNKGRLNDLQFSPDERWLAIADRGLTLRPLDRINDPSVLRDDDKNYGTVRFSPTNGTILTMTGSGGIEILDAKTGGSITTVCCSTIGGAVAFSPDGSFFLSAGHWPRVWEVRSGRLVTWLTREREFMLLGPIAFRGSGVLMGSQDGGIRVWNGQTHQSIGTSPRSSDWVDTIAVQEGTGLVVYAGFGKTLRVWNPETNLHHSVTGVRPTSNIVFSSPNGPLVVGLANGTVEYWDVQSGARQAVLHFPGNN